MWKVTDLQWHLVSLYILQFFIESHKKLNINDLTDLLSKKKKETVLYKGSTLAYMYANIQELWNNLYGVFYFVKLVKILM